MNSRSLLLVALIIFYLLVSINSFAARISGKVTDANDATGLTGVVINIKNTAKNTQTDLDGNYTLEGLEDGSYEIVFSYITYVQQVQTVKIKDNQDITLNIKLKPEGKELQEVNVRTNRITNTENATIMEVKNSSVIVSAISAGQIAKTMDRNAGDVVKRVPGVTIKDDRFIVVRGLADRYNTVWLNDAGAPSSEVDKKSFSFDILPSGLIDRILVYKTPSPELPGDFAGGMVKIYTKSIPDRNEYTVGLQTQYRQYSTGTDFNYTEPSKTDWMGYDDGQRGMPADAPAYISKAEPNNADVTRMFKNNWAVNTKKQTPDMRLNVAASNVFGIGKAKIGNTFGASYTNVSTNFQIERQAWDSSAPVYHYMDRQSVNNVNVALMNNTAVSIRNNKIEFKNLYNQTGRSIVTSRQNVYDTLLQVADERSYMQGYDSRAVYFSQLSGTHSSNNDNREYNWTLGYTDLFKNQPDLRRIKYSKQHDWDDTLYQAGIANVVDPINGGGRFYAQLFERVYSFNHLFKQKVNLWDKYSFDISAGNFIEYKERVFYARVLGYTIRPGFQAQQLTRQPINQIFSDSNIAGERLFNMDEITAPSDKYDAGNKLIASFVSLTLPVGNKVKVFGGVRYEHNTQTLHGYRNLDTLDPVVVTKYFLPSVNVTYNFNEKSLVRAAYGKTLNRPEFREWAPFYFYDFEERAEVYGSLFQSLIAPNGDTLKVAEIQNFDARWEYYPASGEMIHAGVFYKSFKNPIQQVMTRDADSRGFTFTNTESAWSAGAEIEVRKRLDFLDKLFNTKVFRDITLVGNAAWTKSEMMIGKIDTTSQFEKTQLQGQSPYMYNAALFYQNDNIGAQGSILYNVYGPRMYALGTTYTPSLADMPFHSLDLFLSKTFFKHYSITGGVQNLLNQSVVQTQDANVNNKFETNYDDDPQSPNDKQIMKYKPGRLYVIGVKIKF